MGEKFKVACIQLCSDNDIEANLKKASKLIRQATEDGAKLVLTPENVVLMSEGGKDLFSKSFSQDKHPAISEFCKLAKSLNIWLLVGSITIKSENKEKLYNRSLLIDNKGNVIEHYDKIHLYDVQVEGGETHNESKHYEYGKHLKLAKTPWGKLGMTVCYDLRFPHLFRSLAQGGADFISIPSAFTKFTGQSHWEVLLRSRAIENGCYIFAPAQTGDHPKNRETYGHSMIIDPWGKILADAGEDEGYIIVEIDTEKVKHIRSSLPSLKHDQDFS